jgi:hypothetical protein
MDLETNAAGKYEILVSGFRGKPLVARTWFGRTRKELADEYLRYKLRERRPGGREEAGLPRHAAVPVNKGRRRGVHHRLVLGIGRGHGGGAWRREASYASGEGSGVPAGTPRVCRGE